MAPQIPEPSPIGTYSTSIGACSKEFQRIRRDPANQERMKRRHLVPAAALGNLRAGLQ